MALDHKDKVQKLLTIDIVPAHWLYSHVTIEFVQAYAHWFNYLQRAPGPENDLLAQYQARGLKVYKQETRLEDLPDRSVGPWPGAQ